MAVKQVNTQEFDKAIGEGKVFCDFFATWCMPCKMMAPVVDELSEQIPGVTFVKVDVDECQELASRYGIMSIPTMVVFEDGKPARQLVGVTTAEDVRKAIEG